MKKVLYILIIIVNITFGQDVHFSQFSQTPLVINPGLTGNCNGEHRVGLNYREQGSFFTKGYVTSSAFYDGKYLNNQSKRKGYLGMGIVLINDRAGDSRMGITQVGVSFAYFMELIENQIFSLGFQGGFGQRSVDYSNLRWDSQYSNDSYNINIPPEFASRNDSYIFPDVSAGITWQFKKDKYIKTMLGVSLHHINPIKLRYLDVGNEILDRKLLLHGNLQYILKNTGATLIPSFLYERQGKLQEVLGGMLVKLQISELNNAKKKIENYISFGMYSRIKDSFIFTLVIGSKNTKVGFNYDFNSSALSRANNHRGAVEVSAVFNIPYNKRRRGSTLL